MPDLSLLAFVAACVAVASTGAIFRPGVWYDRLAKPPWRPPNWLFGPAWLVLYATIAVSGWVVFDTAGWPAAAVPLSVYGVQLILNGLWSAIFFGMRRMDLAFVEVVMLWLSILATILVFHPVSAFAAWLLVPYLLWVTFAATLNFTVWRMNSASG